MWLLLVGREILKFLIKAYEVRAYHTPRLSLIIANVVILMLYLNAKWLIPSRTSAVQEGHLVECTRDCMYSLGEYQGE